MCDMYCMPCLTLITEEEIGLGRGSLILTKVIGPVFSPRCTMYLISRISLSWKNEKHIFSLIFSCGSHVTCLTCHSFSQKPSRARWNCESFMFSSKALNSRFKTLQINLTVQGTFAKVRPQIAFPLIFLTQLISQEFGLVILINQLFVGPVTNSDCWAQIKVLCVLVSVPCLCRLVYLQLAALCDWLIYVTQAKVVRACTNHRLKVCWSPGNRINQTGLTGLWTSSLY